MTQSTRQIAPPARRLQRLAGRVAGLFGVRVYTMLYSEKDLTGEVEHIEAPDALVVRAAEESELGALVNRLPLRDARMVPLALEQGSECFIAWKEEAMAGYSWINRRRILLLGEPVAELPAEGCYTYNSLVFREFRGRKVFQVLTENVYRTCQQAGFTFCCNLVDRDNFGSIGARKKFGVRTRPAPFLKLPGLRTRSLRGPLPMGFTLRGES